MSFDPINQLNQLLLPMNIPKPLTAPFISNSHVPSPSNWHLSNANSFSNQPSFLCKMHITYPKCIHKISSLKIEQLKYFTNVKFVLMNERVQFFIFIFYYKKTNPWFNVLEKNFQLENCANIVLIWIQNILHSNWKVDWNFFTNCDEFLIMPLLKTLCSSHSLCSKPYQWNFIEDLELESIEYLQGIRIF